MGKLIIDGNCVFEIDEECIKNKKVPKDCDIEKYIAKDKSLNARKQNKEATE